MDRRGPHRTRLVEARRGISNLLSVIGLPLLAACAEEGPPSLPGEAPPPCELSEPVLFLVDEIDPDVANDAEGFRDLGEPDGGNDNTIGLFYHRHLLFHSLWSDAMSDALSAPTVAWVIAAEACQGGGDHLRLSLARARTVDLSTDPPIVELDDTDAIPAVGTTDQAPTQGTGFVPLGALLDSAAEQTAPAWVDATLVSFEALSLSSDRISGRMTFVTPENPSIDAISAAMASTLTEAAESDPDCPDACDDPTLSFFLNGYDENDDGLYDPEEIRSGDFLGNDGINASVDVFSDTDDGPVYWPGHDGVPDGLGTLLRFAGRRVEATTP